MDEHVAVVFEIIKERLARQRIASIVLSVESGGGADEQFAKILAESYNVGLLNDMRHMAAVHKALRDAREGISNTFLPIKNGAITEDGKLGDKMNVDMWIAASAIKVAKERVAWLDSLAEDLDEAAKKQKSALKAEIKRLTFLPLRKHF